MARETPEDCARPGCGHLPASHRLVNPDAACPCPGYRTPEQQLALTAARNLCDTPIEESAKWEFYSALERLLELYP